jgi:D-glycero-D-manno-heptose 1,7-bisphosphate phosphatase
MQALHWHIPRPVEADATPRPAVFFDRDGVITEETGYLHRPEDVRFLPGAVESIAQINRMGIPAILITNQSGIGRGMFTWADYERVAFRIRQGLATAGAWLDAEWACGYYPSEKVRFEPDADRYRKPNPGMIQQAAETLALSLPHSWLIGDKPSDIEAAIRAGLQGAVHVMSGHGAATRAEVVELSRQNESSCRICLVDSIEDALSFLPRS